MPRHLHVLVALFVLGFAPSAQAQSARTFGLASRSESSAGGRLSGIVSSDDGEAVGGVSVLAMGAILAVATSDAAGKFTLLLPAGEYILRAAREGYVSTYREPIRVLGNAQLERHITLVRTESYAAAQTGAGFAAEPEAEAEGSAHGHGEVAWRLRHLPRTVLRDVAVIDVPAGRGASLGSTSMADGPVDEPARVVTSFFAETNFSGQVNFLTTGSLGAFSSNVWSDDWTRGLADVAVGAPVGTLGDWKVRAAMTGGEVSSWAIAGDYRAHADQPHALELGVSYGSQTFPAAQSALGVVPEARAVGSLSAFDMWRVGPLLVLDSGVRVEHYDYLTEPLLASPGGGASVRLFNRTRLRISGGERKVAPGAEQFLPPATSGPWLPPERTFSPLRSGGRLRAESVRQFSVGGEWDLDADGHRTITLDRFVQSVGRQFATLFGIDEASAVGHYYVSSVGNVFVDGWRAGVSGELLAHVRGAVRYTAVRADWTRRASPGAVWQTAPSVVRSRRETVQDLATSVELAVPDTSTHVSLEYRLSSAFAAQRVHDMRPRGSGRFNVELRQALPFQPLRTGELNVLVSLRTLLRDFDEAASFYDELLTVQPPLRVTGGLQVSF